MTDKPNLTEMDRDTLSRALLLETRFEAGIFPSGSGQYRHFRKLKKMGLLEWVGMGPDIDGEFENERDIYKLTDRGKELAEP